MPEPLHDPISEAAAEATGDAWQAEEAMHDDGFDLDGKEPAQRQEATAASEHDRLREMHQHELATVRTALAESAMHDAGVIVSRHEQSALADAFQMYEEGVAPDAIADELMRVAPNAAGAFVRYWEADDQGLSVDELEEIRNAPPATAEEWAQREVARVQARQRLEQVEAVDAHQRAQQEHQAVLERALADEVERARKTLPGFTQLESLIDDLLGKHQVTVNSPEEIRPALETGYRGVREQKRAEAVAEMKADLDELNARHDNGFLNDKPKFDRDAAVAGHIADFKVDLNRLRPARTAEEKAAGARASLAPDEHDRAVEAGWASIDKLDLQARIAQDALRKKGLR
jgi:hypothetical protein